MTAPKLLEERIRSQWSDGLGSPIEIAIAKMLMDVGFQHKRIAALFDCNQGRVAEIGTGLNGRDIGYSFTVEGAANNG